MRGKGCLIYLLCALSSHSPESGLLSDWSKTKDPLEPCTDWSRNLSDFRSYYRVRNKLFRSGACWELTENSWSPDCKFWSPTYFIYNLHKNTILYVTLHARKVTTEERKQLETTRVTLSYKATVVLRWYVSGPKVMVVSIVILNEAKHKTF